MKNTDARRYEMLVRVRDFGESHRDVFPASGPGGQAFEALSAIVQQVGKEAVSKLQASREGRRAKDAAREAVLASLETMVRCARVIARESPGFGEEFQLGRQRSNQALLTTGRMFAQEAVKHTGPFVANGMGETFVESLSADLDHLEQAVKKWEAGRRGHAAARVSIEANLATALTLVSKLDIFVSTRFAADHVTMAMWERARKTEHQRRVRRGRGTPAGALPAEPSSQHSAQPGEVPKAGGVVNGRAAGGPVGGVPTAGEVVTAPTPAKPVELREGEEPTDPGAGDAVKAVA